MVIQLSENTLSIKSNNESVHIKCSNSESRQIAIHKNSIIHLKSHCQITGKVFSVLTHHRDFKDSVYTLNKKKEKIRAVRLAPSIIPLWNFSFLHIWEVNSKRMFYFMIRRNMKPLNQNNVYYSSQICTFKKQLPLYITCNTKFLFKQNQFLFDYLKLKFQAF